MRRLLPALAAVAAAALIAACGENSATDATPVTGVDTVRVRDNTFTPPAVQVPAGTTVTWRFEGSALHDVKGDGFESERMTKGMFTHTFATTGTYPYRCTIHGGMTGRVIVTN